jgi:hypothetical protein
VGSGERRRAIVATLCVALVGLLAWAVSGTAGEPVERSKKPKRAPVNSIAYGVLLNSWGRWVGPREGGEPDYEIIERLRSAHPAYLRVTTPGNRCPKRLPDAKPCMDAQPGNPIVAGWLQQLRKAGISLGAGINAYYRKNKARPARGVIRQACAIKKANANGLYDFVFLDFALRRRHVLQRVIDRIHSGRGCSAGGWRLIMTNDTIFHSPDAADPAARVWAHAKRFSLLDPEDGRDKGKVPDWKQDARLAARRKIPSILAPDRSFIHGIRRRYPHSHVVLKLEVPHQTGDRFGRLSSRIQRRLLRRWGRAEERQGFKTIFPLYVHQGRAKDDYVSWKEGTFRLQKRLICMNRPGHGPARCGSKR